MVTPAEIEMRREALEEAASHAHSEAHPDTIPEIRILDDHPDGRIPANPEAREAVHKWGIDARFRLAIRAALVGAIACLAVACGGRIDAGADLSSAVEPVTCATPEGSAPLPAASVVITRADGSLAASESCENGATCYVLSAPPSSGRGTEIFHAVRGACVVSR